MRSRRGGEPAARPPGVRSGRRRGFRALSWVLLVAAMLLATEGALVLLWKEPVTSFLQAREQAGLDDRLDRAAGAFTRSEASARPVAAGPAAVGASAAGSAAASARPPERPPLAASAAAWRRSLEPGAPVARLRIPDIGVDQVVVEGTEPDELTNGPGHYPATALPGADKTIAIAGHRTTWGAPFRHVDDLEAGDEIELELPYGTFTFTVTGTRIVDDQDFSILDETGDARLVLTACHPLYSASQRIVVEASLRAVKRA